MKDEIARALRSALWTFIGLFGFQLLGFLNAIQEWAADKAPFPSVNPLAKALVSAVVAVVIGLVTYIINWAENNLAKFPALFKPQPPALDPVGPPVEPEA